MSKNDWHMSLLAEHEIIITLLQRLSREAKPLGAKKTSFGLLHCLIQHLLDFGDSIHNVKEENHLFPLMVARGISQEGPIKQMLLDHEAEREFLSRALIRPPQRATATNQEQDDYFNQIMQYIHHRLDHIKQENEELFPSANKVLHQKDDNKLSSAFAIVDKKNNFSLHWSAIQRTLKE